jgi:tRNA(Ile)-lysidine synthase
MSESEKQVIVRVSKIQNTLENDLNKIQMILINEYGAKCKDLIEKEQNEIKFPLKMAFCNVDDILNQATNTIFVDEDKLQFPLEIRKWQEGDYFYPAGMNGKKKLSKYFKDEKYSLLDKENQWLLCSEDQIIWVIGKRADQRFIATERTQQIIKIDIT